jgi:L-cysteine desulfidase
MKKLISIIIICSIFNTIAFSQKVDENNSEPEQSIIDFLDNNQELIKSYNDSPKINKSKRQELSTEKKYNLSRTRILRDPINRSLYNEKIRGTNGYRYNNRF